MRAVGYIKSLKSTRLCLSKNYNTIDTPLQNGPSKEDVQVDSISSASNEYEVDDIIRLNISGGYFEVVMSCVHLNGNN